MTLLYQVAPFPVAQLEKGKIERVYWLHFSLAINPTHPHIDSLTHNNLPANSYVCLFLYSVFFFLFFYLFTYPLLLLVTYLASKPRFLFCFLIRNGQSVVSGIRYNVQSSFHIRGLQNFVIFSKIYIETIWCEWSVFNAFDVTMATKQ